MRSVSFVLFQPARHGQFADPLFQCVQVEVLLVRVPQDPIRRLGDLLVGRLVVAVSLLTNVSKLIINRFRRLAESLLRLFAGVHRSAFVLPCFASGTKNL